MKDLSNIVEMSDWLALRKNLPREKYLRIKVAVFGKLLDEVQDIIEERDELRDSRAGGNELTNAAFEVFEERIYKLEDALKLVLLFHGGLCWSSDKQATWQRIIDEHGAPVEATTKVMCDHIRKVLKNDPS